MKSFIPLVIFTVLSSSYLSGQTRFIGTTEPIRQAQMSFPESGMVDEIPVVEGQVVKAGDVLAKLDAKVLEASLRIAMIQAESDSAVLSAEANWNLRKRRYDELSRLARYGSANKDEVARAKAEFEISAAELAAAQEGAASKKINVEQISAQIDRHSLESPFDGVVTRIFSEISEIVQPGQGPVLTVAQLDQLHLILHIDHQTASGLQVDQVVQVKQIGGGEAVESYPATISFISPVTDSASGTTRVKLTIPNEEGRHRAGLKYSVEL